MSGPVGVYPGSFDPPTIAHLAVAETAVAAAGLHRLDLVFSRDALGKDTVSDGQLERRRRRLHRAVADRSKLAVAVRSERLIVDLAHGYDAVVLGADKWRQVLDPVWYGSSRNRDRALERLPLVLIAPRGTDEIEDLEQLTGRRAGPEIRVLDLPRHLRDVSSTAVRRGVPEAEGWEADGAH